MRRFLAGLEAAHPQATTVLEFDPDEGAQVDFGKGPEVLDRRTGELLSTWIFVMTLAWSRHAYAEVVTDQKVATWLGCHRRAFEWFNGVPRRLTIDNPKCAITRACYHDPEVQRAYAECAEGYGFKIEPCPVRDPKKKGRVESSVKYVKRSFVPLREFRDLVDANAQLRAWLLGPAGNRVHGTTHERPLTRFVETEREFLRPLPSRPPELAVWARVKLHPDCHVHFEKAYYSASFRLARQRLWLRATETTVQLFRDHELVATHPRRFQPGNRSTIDEHLPPPRASCWQAVSPKLGHVHHHGERRHGAVGDAGAVAHGCEPVPDVFGGDGVHGQMTEGGEDVLADDPAVGLPRPGLPVPSLTVEELGGEGIHRAPRRAGAAVVPDHFGEGGDEPAGLSLI